MSPRAARATLRRALAVAHLSFAATATERQFRIPTMPAPSAPSPITYRRATAADAPALAALAAAVWIHTYCEQGVPTDFAEYVLGEFTATKLTAALADPQTVFWLAEATDGPVGFAHLRLGAHNEHVPDRRQAEVSRLYVLNRFSRRGLGRALLARCHTTAADSGATALWLTMYGGNDHARAFYRTLGWRKVGDWAFTLAGESYPNDVLAIAVGGTMALATANSPSTSSSA